MRELKPDNWFVCHECNSISYKFDCCNETYCNGSGCDTCCLVSAEEPSLHDVVKYHLDCSNVPEKIKQSYRELLLYRLGELINKDFLPKWLTIPNDAFSNKQPRSVRERFDSPSVKPIDLLNSSSLNDIDQIWRIIYFLESGQPL